MSVGVIESLKRKSEAEVVKGEAEWQAIVAKLADEAATEKEVAVVLKLTGRNLDELQSDVDREKRVRLLRGELTQFRSAVTAQRQAAQRLSDFRAEREATQKRLDTELGRVRGESHKTGARVTQLREYATELQRLIGEPVDLQLPEANAVVAPVAEVQHITSPGFDIQLPSDSVPA